MCGIESLLLCIPGQPLPEDAIEDNLSVVGEIQRDGSPHLLAAPSAGAVCLDVRL